MIIMIRLYLKNKTSWKPNLLLWWVSQYHKDLSKLRIWENIEFKGLRVAIFMPRLELEARHCQKLEPREQENQELKKPSNLGSRPQKFWIIFEAVRVLKVLK